MCVNISLLVTFFFTIVYPYGLLFVNQFLLRKKQQVSIFFVAFAFSFPLSPLCPLSLLYPHSSRFSFYPLFSPLQAALSAQSVTCHMGLFKTTYREIIDGTGAVRLSPEGLLWTCCRYTVDQAPGCHVCCI